MKKNAEKKKITGFDVAKFIVASVASSGASTIVYTACKTLGPVPKSKLGKISYMLGAFALSGAAGAVAWKQIEDDFKIVDVFRGMSKAIKEGIANAKEEEEDTETPDPPMTEEIYQQYGEERDVETEE